MHHCILKCLNAGQRPLKTMSLNSALCYSVTPQTVTTTTTTTNSIEEPFFQDNLRKPAPERQTILDFTGARYDGVAEASAEPHANHLHLAPDR